MRNETEIEIKRLADIGEKRAAARKILESLTDWFGIADAREEYIQKSGEGDFFCAASGNSAVGFIQITETGKDTAEVTVMGVLPEYHRQGIGKALVNATKEYAREAGYSFLQVKTVKQGMYEQYDRTNRFYLSVGFKEFEVFETLWDEFNPCQIYVMSV